MVYLIKSKNYINHLQSPLYVMLCNDLHIFGYNDLFTCQYIFLITSPFSLLLPHRKIAFLSWLFSFVETKRNHTGPGQVDMGEKFFNLFFNSKRTVLRLSFSASVGKRDTRFATMRTHFEISRQNALVQVLQCTIVNSATIYFYFSVLLYSRIKLATGICY